MTYDPFICDECWGDYAHLPLCPHAQKSRDEPASAALSKAES